MVAYTTGSPGIEGFPAMPGGAAVPHGEGSGTRKVAVDLDFAAIIKARAAAGLPALLAGDTVYLGYLAKGSVIVGAASNVLVANGAAAAIGLGTPTTPAGILAAVPTGTAGWAITSATLPFAVAADVPLLLTLTAVPTTAKVRLVMTVADLA